MIEPIATDAVTVCFACNDTYAIHLKTTIKSLMLNIDKSKSVDILILYTNISDMNKQIVLALQALFSNCSIRFVDVSDVKHFVPQNVDMWYSSETFFRLLLFTDYFALYKRILYLDVDIAVVDDITELYSQDLDDKSIGAMRDISLIFTAAVKRGLIFEHKLYNIDKYLSQVLKIEHNDMYFNAGVLLLDLEKCRARYNSTVVLNMSKQHKYVFNDQDVLNIVFNNDVKLLDIKFNYQNIIESMSKYADLDKYVEQFHRTKYVVIHYVGEVKPWDKKCSMDEYWNYFGK